MLQKRCKIYLQCVNNHYAKFEYRGMKTVGVTYYTNQISPKHSDGKKMSMFNTPKSKKYLSNVQNMQGAYLQRVNNHSEKFE